MLGRVGPILLEYPREHRARLLAAVHTLVEERFPPRLDARLPFPLRLRAALLRAGRDDDLLVLAAVETGITGTVDTPVVEGSAADGRLQVHAETALVLADGRPPAFEVDPAPVGSDGPGRVVWRPPVPLAPDVLTPDVRDAGPDLADDGVQVFLRDLGDEAVHPVGPSVPGTTADVSVDPATLRFGRGLPERWELFLELRRAGWRRRVPLTPPSTDETAAAEETAAAGT